MDQEALIHQLQQQLQQMQQQMAQFMAAQAANPQAPKPEVPVAVVASKKIKIPTPELFDGKREKLKIFLRQCNLVFSGDKKNYKDDQDKITYALSLMRGGIAEEWAGTMMDKREGVCKGEAINPFDDWEDFCNEMDCAFGNPNPEDMAQTKLRRIFQGNRTAEDYIVQFQTYETQTGFDKKALIEAFKRNMNPRLSERIYNREKILVTLHGWQTTAMEVE